MQTEEVAKGRECQAMGVAIDAFNDLDNVLIEEADQKRSDNDTNTVEHVL